VSYQYCYCPQIAVSIPQNEKVQRHISDKVQIRRCTAKSNNFVLCIMPLDSSVVSHGVHWRVTVITVKCWQQHHQMLQQQQLL
jgi:hypothetical protein